MNPIDCAARNEGRVCLSCEAWEAGVRAGETVLMSLAQPNTDSLDETEREVLLDFMESLGFSARVALDLDAADGLLMINQTQPYVRPSPLTIGEPLRFNGHGAFDLDGEDDGEP